MKSHGRITLSWLTLSLVLVAGLIALQSSAPAAPAAQETDATDLGANAGGDGILSAPAEIPDAEAFAKRVCDQCPWANVPPIIFHDPKSGLTVVGLGKGVSVPAGASGPNDNPWEQIPDLYLGTGIDGNTNVTGERSVFGPGDPLYLAVEYYDVYHPHTMGPGWYRPDGATYYQQGNEFTLPDPQDFGHTYWDIYKLYVSYSPIPGDIESHEGLWKAKWFTDGWPVGELPFTEMFILDDHKMCGHIVSWDKASDFRTTFYTDEATCDSWLRMKNYILNFPKDVEFAWWSPSGLYRDKTYDIPDPQYPSVHYDLYCSWDALHIAGQYPASHRGNWRVDTYIADYAGVCQFRYSNYFTIAKRKLAFLRPVSSVSLTRGHAYRLKWSRTDDIEPYVILKLYHGATFKKYISRKAKNTGSLNWTIPRTLAATTYRVKVLSYAHPATIAWSAYIKLK